MTLCHRSKCSLVLNPLRPFAQVEVKVKMALFQFIDLNQADLSVARRQGALVVEHAKAAFSYVGDVPSPYATILNKGKASGLKKNNVVAQMSAAGLVNIVLQVVQVGEVIVLYRMTQANQAGCPLYFQWNYDAGDEVLAFSSLGIQAVVNGPSRIDYTPLSGDASVLIPAFESTGSSTSANTSSSSSTSEKYVSANLADALADGAAFKNLLFQDSSKGDQYFTGGTKQITQGAINKLMTKLDSSSLLRKNVLFQANVVESMLGSNFGDYQQPMPSSSSAKVKSMSYLWASSFDPGSAVISNEVVKESFVAVTECWDAISERKCVSGRGFFSEATAGIIDLFNPLRKNVLPYSPAFNAVWVQEVIIGVSNVMRLVRPVVLTEGELTKQLTDIFFSVSHEQIAVKYRSWTESWPHESQLWLAKCAEAPLTALPTFGGLSVAPLGSVGVLTSGDGDAAQPLKKARLKKPKVVSAVVQPPAVAAASLAVPAVPNAGTSGRSTRSSSSGVSPGSLCQYHVKHLFCGAKKCHIKNCANKFIHQACVKTYHQNDMLAWAEIVLVSHSDYDDVVDAIKLKA